MISLLNFFKWILLLEYSQVFLVNKVLCQTPTGQWLFDAPTTSTSTNNVYNGGTPSFLTSNPFTTGQDSRMVGNGYYYEDDEMSCTSTTGGSAINSVGHFSIDLWFYMNEKRDQTLMCKIYNTGTDVNPRWCLTMDGGGNLEMEMNKQTIANGNTNLDNINLHQCEFENGWNHVTVTFEAISSTKTDVTCYVQTDSGKTTTDSKRWNQDLDDNNLGQLCAGAKPDFTSTSKEFDGIINEFTFYKSTLLTSTQALALVSTTCNSICTICKPGSTTCLQEQSEFIAKYDFIQPVYPTGQIQLDGQNSYDLDVNSDFDITPIYVDNQGLYFDTTFSGSNQYMDSITSTDYNDATSFTLETWIKPETQLTNGMHLFEKESASGTDYVDWGFSGPDIMYFKMNGQSFTFNIGSTNINDWMYMAVSVNKQSTTQSEVCIKVAGVTVKCKNFNSVLSDSGTMITKIGDGYQGYMRNMWVTDYAKEQLDIGNGYTTTCSNNINGNSCTYCPRETGQCIGDCPYGTYGSSCTACYPDCKSCWGGMWDECFSCISSPGVWDFDYVNACYSQCGDGSKDDWEDCEDGNLVNGDGCDSTCNAESGWTCYGGSFTGTDTCQEDCQDGFHYIQACDDGNGIAGDGCDTLCQIETGFTCSGTPSVCTPTCGDGLRVGIEECDDGNVVNNDGCSSACLIETGWNCTQGTVISSDVCIEICGDGLDFGNYECDDGNSVNFDGCNQWCDQEIGYTCSGGTSSTPDTCKTDCGDGRNFLTYVNECDDGNLVNGDGCSSSCVVETGWQCLYGSQYGTDTCSEICGDSKNFQSYFQECDDGNLFDDDGCHSDCTIEIGWTCDGGSATSQDTCTELCGDGRNFGTYACDDGNMQSGDGCSSTCTVESGFVCTTGDPYTKSQCVTQCNGIRDYYDMCDDGNLVNGDGCDYCCKREKGYVCTGGSLSSADTCTEACGDGIKMNILECDDGNQVNGDGCDSTCSVETGYTCSGGTLFTPDKCLEICGDGKNLGNYECDDGNNSNNDGCAYNCMLEDGYTCTGGTFTSPDTCTEICGDGKDMGNYDCDDGNTVNGDGCMSNCTLETGFTCAQGNYYAPDVCEEVCGDGRNMGLLQCDDGNTEDGDGCSAYCAVESGYACSGGTNITADDCYTLSAPKITNAYISRDNSKIYLEYNETIYLNSKWTTSSWTMSMAGPLGRDNYQFTWNVSLASDYKNLLRHGTKQMIVDFNCTQQLYGNNLETIRIDFDQRYYVKSVNARVPQINTSATVHPYGQENANASGMCGFPDILKAVTYILIFGPILIGVIGSFLGLSMGDVWQMMYTLQLIYLFPTANLYVPSCVTYYIKLLFISMPTNEYIADSAFGGLTNHTYLQIENPSPFFTFDKMGFQSTAFIWSAADILSLLLYIIVILGIMEVLKQTFSQNKFVVNTMNRFKAVAIPAFFQYTFLKFAFTSHLNLKHLNFSDTQTAISSLMALGFGVFCWVYTIYMTGQAFLFMKEVKKARDDFAAQNEKAPVTSIGNLVPEEQYIQEMPEQKIRDLSYYRGNILFQDYNITSDTFPITLFYQPLLQFKQLIIAILFIQNDTQTQMVGMMFTNVISMITVLLIYPYNSLILNIQLIFNEMATFVFYMQVHTFLPRSRINEEEYNKYSKLFVIMVLFIIFINACLIVGGKATKLFKCKSESRTKADDKAKPLDALKPNTPKTQTPQNSIKPINTPPTQPINASSMKPLNPSKVQTPLETGKIGTATSISDLLVSRSNPGAVPSINPKNLNMPPSRQPYSQSKFNNVPLDNNQEDSYQIEDYYDEEDKEDDEEDQSYDNSLDREDSQVNNQYFKR